MRLIEYITQQLNSQIERIGYAANNTGVTIQSMTEKQKNVAIIGLVVQINIITGCPIPTDERHLKILESEIKKFLNDHKHFQDLTIEEILNAFRLNAAGKFDEKINHYQNIFNLDYLGAVLLQWIPIKKNIKIKVERELIKKNLLELDEIPGLNEDEIIQFSKDEWIRTQDLMFLESRAYNLLLNRGDLILTNDQKSETLLKARAKINLICRYTRDIDQYYGNPTVETIVSKKIAIAEYFNNGPIEVKSNNGFMRLPHPDINLFI